ncbi:MAG: ABC transporter ATP-binding protein [Desulfurella sp.]|uniref:ABC transporter ATP-binding protein n=1 Tax=Desulfurella sp. TaxID=1962857 RepID=UPI003D0BEA4C
MKLNINKEYLKRLLLYIKPYWKRIILSFIAMIIVGALTSLTAYLIKPVLDKIFIAKDKKMLILLPFAVMATYFFKGLFTYIQSYQTAYVAENILFNIRNQMFKHIVSLPVDFFEKYHTSELLSRVLNDTERLQDTIARVMPEAIREFFTIIFLFIVIYTIDFKLALISTIVFPIALYPIIKFGKDMKKLGKKRQVSIAAITTLIQESFFNIRLIKGFLTEEKETEKFFKKSQEFLNINLKSFRISEITSPLMEFIGSLGIAFLIWFGGLLVFRGAISVGGFFSFMAGLFMLYRPFKTIAKASNSINSSIGAIERVFFILDTKSAQETTTKGIIFEGVKNSIVFDNVSFSYDGKKYALKNINLEVKAKTIVAFVGESGGGKTTLMDLIPRFYDPTDGRILIDGIDIKDFDIKSLRKKIASVSQNVLLFADTVFNNIAYGLENPDKEKVIEAAKLAYAHDFIMKLPNAYDTNLGEQAVILSGGERQRIAIARAIMKNPDILILDEATSALDAEAESYVQKAISNLIKNRTVFLVAHRLSTALSASKIVVIKQGQIVGIGTHKELLENNKYYQRLIELQFENV